MKHLTSEECKARWKGLIDDIAKDLAEVNDKVHKLVNEEERMKAIAAMDVGIGSGAMTTLASDARVAAGKLREDLEEVNFYEHTCLNW